MPHDTIEMPGHFRPRVLMVNIYHPPSVGGMETVGKTIVDQLRDFVDFHVLVAQRKGPRSVETVDGVRVERAASWGVVRSAPVSFDFLRRYRQLAPQFDLVHFHEPFPVGTLSSALFGAPRAVVTFHSEVLRQRVLKHVYHPLLDRLLKRCAAIMPTSPRLAEYAPSLADHTPAIRPVPLAIDDTHLQQFANNKAEIAAVRQRYSADAMFLMVGRCVGYKGFEVAIDALAKVPDGDLVIIGDGPLRTSLMQRAREHGLHDRVHFAGKVSARDLALHLHACDALVLPSTMNTEAFGLVQAEAMACGKPVINTNLPTGVPFVSVHDHTGLTVEPGDAGALAAAMWRLAGDAELRISLGKNARARYVAEFHPSRFRERLLAVYREVLPAHFAAALTPQTPERRAA